MLGLFSSASSFLHSSSCPLNVHVQIIDPGPFVQQLAEVYRSNLSRFVAVMDRLPVSNLFGLNLALDDRLTVPGSGIADIKPRVAAGTTSRGFDKIVLLGVKAIVAKMLKHSAKMCRLGSGDGRYTLQCHAFLERELGVTRTMACTGAIVHW